MTISLTGAPPRTVTANRRWRPYAPLGLPVAVVALFFAAPMALMLGVSFQGQEPMVLTLANYRRFLTGGLFLAGLGRTVVMSALVSVAVTIMAYPIAYFLARSRSRWRLVVFAVAIAPELAGVVLRTYGWLVILDDHGILNQALLDLHLITSPLPLSKSMAGVVIGLTHVIMPFGVLSLLSCLQGIDPNLERSAQILGASRLSILRHVLLPLSVPGLVSSLLLSFTMAASAYATPALLGGAGFRVMATMVSEQVLFYQDWPFAAVMANVLLVLMLLVAIAGSRLEAGLQRKLHL